jgi:hypothetical protein
VDAGILENVTNTASGTGSKLIDLQVGGTSQFSVDDAGNVAAAGVVALSSSVAGYVALSQGTAAPLGSNAVTLTVPSSVTSYNVLLPGSIGSANQVLQIASVAGGVATMQWGSAALNVNGSPVSSPNLNSTTPAAGSGYTNATLQVSGSNISIETPNASWNSLVNPTGNLTLSMGTYTSEWDYTSGLNNAFLLNNTTAATALVWQSSPVISLCGAIYATGSSHPNCATIQNVVNESAGTNYVVIGQPGQGTGLGVEIPNQLLIAGTVSGLFPLSVNSAATTLNLGSNWSVTSAGAMSSVSATLSGTGALTLSAMSGTNCLEEISGVVTAASGACSTASSVPLSGVTGSATQATATETGTGQEWTYNGVETANLTAPVVFENTNSSLLVNAPGTSTGQLGLAVNGAGTGSDLIRGYSGSTVTNGVLSGGTLEFQVQNGGTIVSQGSLQLAGHIQSSTNPGIMYIQSGTDNTTTSIGLMTVRGGDITGGSSAVNAGNNWIRAGNDASTSTSSAAGTVELSSGAATGSTPGLQGLALIVESYAQTGTVTQWNLECFTGTAMTVDDCGASPTNIAGVALSKSGSVQVNVAAPPSEIPINASAAVTIGDTVCAGSTAGKVTDSGGTSPCTSGITVGTVVAISGSWPSFPDGTSFPSLSTTLPLVRLTGLGAGGDNYHLYQFPAANQNAGTVGIAWTLPATNPCSPTAKTGTNVVTATLTCTTSQYAMFSMTLSQNWDTTVLPYVRFWVTSTDTTSGHTLIPTVAASCSVGNGTASYDQAFQTAQPGSTITFGGSEVASAPNTASSIQLNSTSMTNCVAGSVLTLKMSFSSSQTATEAEYFGIGVTVPEKQVAGAQ